MFDIRKPKQKVSVPIRAASKVELVNYEKHKAATDKESLTENKIEAIRVNDNKLQIDPINKEVRIDLGNLAFKSKISPSELTADEYFFISCELDENDLK